MPKSDKPEKQVPLTYYKVTYLDNGHWRVFGGRDNPMLYRTFEAAYAKANEIGRNPLFVVMVVQVQIFDGPEPGFTTKLQQKAQ